MDAIHKFSQQNLVESVGTENETNTGMLGTFLSGINKQVRMKFFGIIGVVAIVFVVF